jgi:hypothetical protein
VNAITYFTQFLISSSRTCVGVAFANQSLFIDFALLLWAFKIEKAVDAHGNEILPSLTDVIDAGVVV